MSDNDGMNMICVALEPMLGGLDYFRFFSTQDESKIVVDALGDYACGI